jgi:hypothetical protein
MSDVTVERGNPVEVTVVQGDPIEVSLSYAVTPDLDDGSIPLAKLADLAASRLIGRGSAGGTGAPEAITLGAGLSMSGTSLTSSVVGMTVNVYEYHSDTGSGNRTPTTGTEFWIVEGVGGGAAGQAGGTTSGGFGGAAGNYASLVIPAAQLTGSMAITVGSGATTFGTPAGSTKIERASDSVVLFLASGAFSNTSAHFPGVPASTSFGAGGSSAGGSGRVGGYGSGGGAGGASSNTQWNGGAARNLTMTTGAVGLGGGGLGGTGQAGMNGSSGSIHASGFGDGGGGGGFSLSGTGGNGAAGLRGGGGGGGGRGLVGGGGAGGPGGAGFIRIIEVVRA